MEAKQEAYEQDMKAVHAKVEAVSKEMDNINAKFGELDVSLQETVEERPNGARKNDECIRNR